MAQGYSDTEQLMNQTAKAAQLMPMDPLGRLRTKRQALVEALDRTDKAIAAMEANPGVSEILRLLAEAGERY